MKGKILGIMTAAMFILASGCWMEGAQAQARHGATVSMRVDSLTAQRLKVLQQHYDSLGALIKQQQQRLGTVYRDVSPEVQEAQSDREDSIYLSLLSRQTGVALQMKEVKRGSLLNLIGRMAAVGKPAKPAGKK